MQRATGAPPDTASRIYNCPVEASLDVLGGKWKIILLWYLGERPHRFGELGSVVPNISDKMLTQQLRELEADGLVSRTVFPEVPPRVEYALTPYGETTKPVIAALCDWGEIHCRRIDARAEWMAR